MSNIVLSEGFNASTDAEYIDPVTGEVSAITPVAAGASVVRDAIERLQSGRSDVFSTVTGTDFASKVKVLTAVTAAESIGQAIDDAGKGGLRIRIDNVVVQAVELHERDAKGNRLDNMITSPRVILLTDEGKAYFGFSPTLLKDVATFIGLLGQPNTWPEPQPTQITREKAGIGTYFKMVYDTAVLAKK